MEIKKHGYSFEHINAYYCAIDFVKDKKMKKIGLMILSSIFIWSCSKKETQRPKNILLIIGDGMGLTQISAGNYTNNNHSNFEAFTHIGLQKTHAVDKLITDSAASGTAMATGIKTYNGAIAMSKDQRPQKSILEICVERNYKTALLTTSSIVHATPAVFYAKATQRKLYDEIATYLPESGVNYFIGGGRAYLYKDNKTKMLLEKNYRIVKDLNSFEKESSTKMGLFTADKEPVKQNEGRPPMDKATEIVLDKLRRDDRPFFMMIEGAQIDWGSHANDQEYLLSEWHEFNKILKIVIEFAKEDANTLVVVTADHETGGTAITEGNLSNEIIISFSTKSHSATMVPVFAFGPGAEKFSGIYENTEIFHKLKQLVK